MAATAAPQRFAPRPRAIAATEPRLLSDPFRLAILVLLFETISKFTGFFEILWPLRLAAVLFAFTATYAVLKPKAIDTKILRYRVPRLIVAQFALACASAAFGISQGSAAHFILDNYWKTIAFAMLLIASIRGLTDTRRMVKATAFAGIVLAFVSVFIIHVSKESGTGTYDANDLGLIVVMTLPLALLVMQTSKGLWRIISMLGIGLIGVTIPMTASRGAFVGCIAVGTALLIFLPGVSVIKRVMSLFAIIGIMVAVAPASYWESMKSIIVAPENDYNWDAGQGRKELATRGMGYMLRYPIFGIGIYNFGKAEIDPAISPYAAAMSLKRHGYRPAAPHNSWVQAGAETGVGGILLWAALVVGSAWGVVRLRRQIPASWAKAGTPDQKFIYLATLYVPIAVLGFAVCGTFVSFAWSDQSYVLPAIALGIHKSFAEQMRLAGAPVQPAQTAARSTLRRPVFRRAVPVQRSRREA